MESTQRFRWKTYSRKHLLKNVCIKYRNKLTKTKEPCFFQKDFYRIQCERSYVFLWSGHHPVLSVLTTLAFICELTWQYCMQTLYPTPLSPMVTYTTQPSPRWLAHWVEVVLRVKCWHPPQVSSSSSSSSSSSFSSSSQSLQWSSSLSRTGTGRTRPGGRIGLGLRNQK